MTDQMTTDVRALLDREPFDKSVVADLREALGRDPSRYKTLREAIARIHDKHKGKLTPDAHLRLGVAEVLQGHYQSALDHLTRAGKDGLAHYHRGLALENLQRWNDAVTAFEEASNEGYETKLADLHRVGALRRSGNLEAARSLLKKLSSLESSSGEYHYQLGCMLADEGDSHAAVAQFEKAVELDREHTGALFQLAYVSDLNGFDDDAKRYYQQCISRPPVPLAALINLGILYEDEGQYRKAEECYAQVLAYDQNHPRARLYTKDCKASADMYYDEDLEKQFDKLKTLLEIPVTDFELSVRSRNCLKKMNIRTLGDLTRTTEAQLLASKNFGETSLSEIKEIMNSKGLRLGMALEAGERGVVGHSPMTYQQELSQEERALLAKPVAELNLSVRARKCMSKLNLGSLGDLVMRTGDELLECKNFGVTSLNEVREKLSQFGLKLKGD